MSFFRREKIVFLAWAYFSLSLSPELPPRAPSSPRLKKAKVPVGFEHGSKPGQQVLDATVLDHFFVQLLNFRLLDRAQVRVCVSTGGYSYP
jgi:hypothetical protein